MLPVIYDGCVQLLGCVQFLGRVQLSVTPWTIARSSVRGTSQARILEWIAISFSIMDEDTGKIIKLKSEPRLVPLTVFFYHFCY